MSLLAQGSDAVGRVTGTDSGWWDRTWPLVVAALLSLAVFYCVQLYFVPQVEARKRREDRWERDVLDFGQLLTFDVPKAFSAIREELAWERALHEAGDGSAEVVKLRADHRLAQRVALDDYRDLTLRMSWLSDRILSIDPNSDLMRQFSVAEVTLVLKGIDNLATPLRAQGESPPTEEKLLATDAASREALEQLVAVVKVLAGTSPPRPRHSARQATPRRTGLIGLIHARGSRARRGSSPQ